MTKKFYLLSILIILSSICIPVFADMLSAPFIKYNVFAPGILIPVIVLSYISLVNIFIVLSQHEHG